MRGPSLRATIHPADGGRLEYRFSDARARARETGSEPWTAKDIVLTRLSSTGSLVDRATTCGRYEIDRIDGGREFGSVELVGRDHAGIEIRKRVVVAAFFDALVVCHDLRPGASDRQGEGLVGLLLPDEERGAAHDSAWAAIQSGDGSHVHMVIGIGPPAPQWIRSLLSWGDWALHGDSSSDGWDSLDASSDQAMP